MQNKSQTRQERLKELDRARQAFNQTAQGVGASTEALAGSFNECFSTSESLQRYKAQASSPTRKPDPWSKLLAKETKNTSKVNETNAY